MTKVKEYIEARQKAADELRAKAAAKNTVTSSTAKDANGLTAADREERSIFFKALASGDRNEIQKSNDIQVKGYEARGIDWRTDGEARTKAQTVGTVGSGASGGVLVPTTLRSEIIEKLYYISPVRQIATVINDMPPSLDMPFDNALPTTTWIGEGVAIPESSVTFSKKNMQPNKLAGFDSFTSESLADTASSPELQKLVVDRFATAMALAENAAFVNGTGSAQPFGFRSSDISPTALATNSTAGNLAYGDIVQQFFTLPTAYRNLGVWVTSSTGVQILDGIKDTAGRPIFLPGQSGVAGENLVPSSLYTRPLFVVDEVPSNLGTGTNETQLWFAVFKDYFIGTRGALRIDYGTNGTDFQQDKLSLRMIERVTARPFLDTAWTVKNIK